MLVGASTTAELIQDDPARHRQRLLVAGPRGPFELSAYQHKESWGASRDVLSPGARLHLPESAKSSSGARPAGAQARRAADVQYPLGPAALGFRRLATT